MNGFDKWWHRNHPFDWWAKDRRGAPLAHGDRLRVWDIAKRAYEAGLRESEAKKIEKGE